MSIQVLTVQRSTVSTLILFSLCSCTADPPASDPQSTTELETSTTMLMTTGGPGPTSEPDPTGGPTPTSAATEPSPDDTSTSSSGGDTGDTGATGDTGNTGDTSNTDDTGTSPTCGDGMQDPGEACDDGPDNGDDKACKADCSKQVCGDGALGPGEGCDDGNVDDRDGCDSKCVPEGCGDGNLNDGELCDDGADGDNDDGCTDICTLPACGDGFVQASLGETCDEGDQNSDTGACKSDCTSAICGDGLIEAGNEVCDDGDENGDGAVCTNECTIAACGDGTVKLGVEECDDGNVKSDDGCTSDCKLELQLALGVYHGCALRRSTGAVHCWGGNGFGQLGIGTTDARGDQPGELPAPAVPLGGKAVEIAAGAFTTCARLESGKIKCWGDNKSGQLALNNTTVLGDEPGELPGPDALVGADAVRLAGAYGTFCALTIAKELHCWGGNFKGHLGVGHVQTLGDQPGELPGPPTPVGFEISSFSLGNNYGCAVSIAGALRCWGGNGVGPMGYENKLWYGDMPGELPTPDVKVGGTVVQLSTGADTTCVLLSTGRVRCWGYGYDGELGYGKVETLGDDPGEMPTADVELGGEASQVVTAFEHTCARMQTGAVKCWGSNDLGQLGLGATQPFKVGIKPGDMPPDDVVLKADALALFAGTGTFTCALLKTGAVRCWGNGMQGKLGIGSTANVGDDEAPGDVPAVPIP